MHYYKKKLLIKHLLFIIRELQEPKESPTAITDNYYNHLLKSLPKEQEALTRELIHYLTLLNKTYREQVNGIYQSSHEDVLIALELIQDLLQPQNILSQKEQEQLEELSQAYLGERFTRKQAQEVLKQSKSQTHRLLNRLEKLELIRREPSNKNRGYSYSFGVQHPDIEELFSDNENIEFTDIR